MKKTVYCIMIASKFFSGKGISDFADGVWQASEIGDAEAMRRTVRCDFLLDATIGTMLRGFVPDVDHILLVDGADYPGGYGDWYPHPYGPGDHWTDEDHHRQLMLA